MSGRGPWWAAANVEAPADEFEKEKAAATAASDAECRAAIEAMRAQAIASMFIPLEDMPAEYMYQA